MRCAASRLARFGYLIIVCAVFCGFSLPLNVAWAEEQPAETRDVNRIVSVTVDADEKNPKVNIRTENPVGYRYTVYESSDPTRVVIDFPRMDVSDIESPLPVDVGPIQEIRAVSFDLTLGKLGRIEVLVDRKTDYRVKIDGNDFVMTFAEPSAPAQAPAAPQKAEEPEKSETASIQDSVPAPAPTPAPAPANAVQVTAVELRDGRADILTDGPVDKYRYFNLSTPPRLVLDIFGVKPSFRERELPGTRGFDRVRVGTYDDKTRFVFDAGGSDLPSYEVSPAEEGLLVTWTPDERVPIAEQPAPEPDIERVESAREKQAAKSGPEPVAAPAQEAEPKAEPVVTAEPAAVENDAPKAEPKPVSARQVAEIEVKAEPAPVTGNMTQAPVQVEDISFAIEGDLSVLTVDLSGPAQVSNPVKRGNVVLFGLDHATIKRSLRRVIDTSAFPSALEMITPYTVNRGTVQDVRFAARLKGDVPYRLKKRGDQLIFEVENGEFAQTSGAAPQIELKGAQSPSRDVVAPASVPAGIDSQEKRVSKSFATQTLLGEETPLSAPPYSGERISLVFDNADVRNLLQLIAEVSDLNIIASEEVSGNVSLRLIDVPWDQALDVILDIKQLGMIREGNVVRILPKSKIREMEEAALTAARNKSELEPLVTRVFSVSYTDLANVAAPLRDVMSERGRLTQDPRNKQIIVKDTPSVIKEIEGLVDILDTPERQVMIEARIVEASSDFTRDLGVNWGISYTSPGSTLSGFDVGMGGNFLVGLPTAGSAATAAGLGSSITIGELGVDKTVIDMRISALESSGKGKIISRPRVSTLNGEEAVITQGTTIPYQTSGADGPKTEFVDATLELKVIPVINPDNSIIMEIEASNSTPGQTFTNADLPGINKKEAKTKVLVSDGDTTVIGGIFVEDDSETESGVPLLMNIPFLGRFFKSTNVEKRRSELLIFITPRILE
ncbi:MAG: type IV pilus secretin PilQ [Geoalkalibacter sp.]|uniref:type IV pilus secretin PilQ n=1 Tax=Geoalkalibacter sp. TaxID=3041440 RepID=UPI003D142ABC